jgi:hypothetical protein
MAFAGCGRWLVIAGATLALGVSVAHAQLKAWPDQQPQRPAGPAWPGENSAAPANAPQSAAVQEPPPMNAGPPPPMMAPGGFGGGMGAPPRQQNACMEEFSKLRGEVEKAGKVAKTVNERKGTREEFCKAITNLHGAQVKWVKYTGDHAKNCGIPGDVVTQLKAGAANLGKMKTNICNGGGATAGAPAAPSLSEALGTATMPATTDDAPRRRGGTLDTLTGAPIR